MEPHMDLILFHQMKTIHLRIVRNSLLFLKKILDCTVVKSVLIACFNSAGGMSTRPPPPLYSTPPPLPNPEPRYKVSREL